MSESMTPSNSRLAQSSMSQHHERSDLLSRAASTARLGSPVPSVQSNANLRQLQSPNILFDRTQQPLPLADRASSFGGPGTSALAAALRNSLGKSPSPHYGASSRRTKSPASAAQSRNRSAYGSFDKRAAFSEMKRSSPSLANLEIVKRHLVQPSSDQDSLFGSARGLTGTLSGVSHYLNDENAGEDVLTGIDEDEFSSLQLQGGDTTRGIYRWAEDATMRSQDKGKLQRSLSMHTDRPQPKDETENIDFIKAPGGFRRDYIRRNAGGQENADLNEVERGGTYGNAGQIQTSNFLEFLSLYGHFAGEDLEEDDEALGPGEYFVSGSEPTSEVPSDEEREAMEESALLTPKKRRRRVEKRLSGKGGSWNTALLLLKSFVGTGVLFLPRAYLNGGMVFSNVTLLAVAALSYWCFVLLVQTSLRLKGSFGHIGKTLYGSWMYASIQFSLVLSQIGFVSAYIVFTSENLQAFILAVTHCKVSVDVKWLVLGQLTIFLPMSLFRNIHKLSMTAYIADVFIALGLFYLYYYDIATLTRYGQSDIVLFNSRDWTLFIGTAIFTFEGIGLIIPIQESMRDPTKFPKVLAGVMVVITCLFVSLGWLGYAAFGSSTKTVILSNLPQDDKMVNAVQFLYSAAILLSTPLQLFPAIRICENELFTKSGKYNRYIKWEKNSFRFVFVFGCAALAWLGAGDLDKFVSVVGSFACIPLVYIYPPALHYKQVARTTLAKAGDVFLGVFGIIAMVYTTALTIRNWASGSSVSSPGYCDI